MMVIFNLSALYLTMVGWTQGFFTCVHQMECTETRKVQAALIHLRDCCRHHLLSVVVEGVGVYLMVFYQLCDMCN